MIRVRDAYDQWSATYDDDENRTRDLDKAVTEEALESVDPSAVLELGCGTGKNTALLAQIGKRVHAIDFSEGMISKARSRVQAKHATFSQADLTREWPAQDQSIDLIACNLVLEHIEALNFIFAEAARTLRENGIFYISELHPFRQYQGRRAAFQMAGKIVEIPAFVHHVSDFLCAALAYRLALLELREWWHDEDQNRAPRLITFRFQKRESI